MELLLHSLFCQPCTSNTEIAGIILVSPHKKKGNFPWENFQFCSKLFWFSVTQIEQTAAQLLTWKAFSAVFHSGKKSNRPKPAKGEARGHIHPLWFSVCSSPSFTSVQQGRVRSSALCLAGSCSAHFQQEGQEGKVRSSSCSCWSCGDQVLAPPTPKPCGNRQPISPGTHYQEPSGVQLETFPWGYFGSRHPFCNFHLQLACFVDYFFKCKGFPSKEPPVSRPEWPQVASVESFRPHLHCHTEKAHGQV